MTRYHFIGIGGMGMSALARILKERGALVQGSDIATTDITEGLAQFGIEIFYEHDPSHVRSASTVIYGSDIKSHHLEYQAAATQNLPLIHRSHLLAGLMEQSESVLVTGTHGKTTTSALVTHVLIESGLDPTFAIGGISLNTSTNGRLGKGKYFVAEADESDGTFLKYQGKYGIITNIEEDHLDFWKTRAALMEGFKTFAAQVSQHVWWCHDDGISRELDLPGKSYGFSPQAYLRITNWCQKGWSLFFDLEKEGKRYPNIQIPLIGKHNVLNATSVFGLALELGIQEQHIRQAFKCFKGVKRRMEKKGENRGVMILDDYAHHPTEIQTTLQGLRAAAGEKRIVALFQPHRYSRFKDCWNGFLEAFEAADVVFVTDIYGARETPIPGLSSEQFAFELKKKISIPVYFAYYADLLQRVGEFLRPHDNVITLGAGNITYVGSELAKYPIKPFQIGILQGGPSAEHEVALLSSKMVTQDLNRAYYQPKHWTISKEGEWIYEGQKIALPDVVSGLLAQDLVFPILHGPFGEDGTIQGFLETLGLPYVGCDFRSCAVSMDKAWTKHIALSHGVKVARFIEFTIQDWIKNPVAVREKILNEFQFPFYIKAVHLGSSFGVHRIRVAAEIDRALENISKLDYRFLVEEEVKGRELEFGFIGDTEVEVSDAAEVCRAEELHTYQNKYCASGNPSIPKVPLPPDVLQKGREIALTVYRAMGCSGLARIDFFLDPEGSWILNEVNPMPGCTPMSVYPVIWKAEGLSLSEVIDRVMIASLHRWRVHKRHLRPPENPPVEL